MRHEFPVTAPDAGRRLDRFVQVALGGVPASLVQRLLRQKKVRVNEARGRADLRLRAGDVVVVHHVARAVEASSLGGVPRAYTGPPIEVLASSDDFLFVHKPAGVSCSDDGWDTAVLALWLAEHLRERIARDEVRPEPCHRLDRGTTGIVAVALTVAAFERFRAALESGAVHKEYEVAVWGAPERQQWVCELPLLRRKRARADEQRVVVAADGDLESGLAWTAVTEFEVLVRGPWATLLRARPRTGRTHQIRAHCFASGLPVVGDPRYGDPRHSTSAEHEPQHQLLHARRLHLDDVHGSIHVEASWPTAEAEVLRSLGLQRDAAKDR